MSLFGTGRREGILAVMLLVVLGIAVHAPGLLFGHHRSVLEPDAISSVPASTLASESATNQVRLFPALQRAGAVVRGGELPLWNAAARFGEPFSFTGAPVWYPPYWIVMADLGAWSLDLLLALHTVLACVGMFRFLRVMPTSRYVSFVGGGAFGLGWFLTASLDRLPEAAATALLPFALECAWRCLSTRRSLRLFVPLLGLVLASMFATGSTTAAWLGLGLCATVLLCGLTAVEREHRLLTLRMGAVALAGAVLLAAPLWLDAWQHAEATQSAARAVDAPRLQPIGVAGMLAPNLFADLRGEGPPAFAHLNAGADPMELLLYPGAFVLFVGLLGLLRPKRTYQKLFWLVVGGIGLLLAVGSPLHAWIGWAPERAGSVLLVFHVAAVVLASLSLETFLEAPMMRRYATTVACWFTIVTVAAFTVSFWIVPSLGEQLLAWWSGEPLGPAIADAREHVLRCGLPAAAGSLAMAILFSIWRRIGLLRFKPLLATFALADIVVLGLIGVPRAAAIDPEVAYASQIPVPTEDRARHVSVGRSAPRPPSTWLMANGVPVVDTSGRAVLARTAGFLSSIDPSCVQVESHQSRVVPFVVPALLDHPMLQVSGIGLASAWGQGNSTQFEAIAAAPSAESERTDQPIVLRSVTPRPRARVVYRTETVPDRADAADRIRRHLAVDPETALLEGAEPTFATKRPAEPARIRWAEDRANHVRIDVELGDGRGVLTVADAYAPGWHATVDGAPAELRPTHLAFRAVALREGSHRVEFHYRPWSWRYGMPLLCAGLAMFLGYFAWAAHRLRAGAG